MEKNLFLNILLIATASGITATVINFVIALISARLLKAAPGFAPFTFLPVAAGCFGSAWLAGIVYYALHFVFDRPERAFTVVSLLALFASFHLPFRLTNHRSPRFAGATLPVQLTLCLMHTLVCATSILALLFLTG